MFKSVLVIIFVVIFLFIARTVMQRLKQPSQKKVLSDKDTVQCAHCKVYLAHDDAILKGDKAFCSTQHLKDWNKST